MSNILFFKNASIVLIYLMMIYPMEVSSEEVVDISLVSLISRPERYQGKLVRVRGYLHYRFEDHALYLTRDDGTYLIGKNSIWLNFSENVKIQTSFNKGSPTLMEINDKFVLLEGHFDKSQNGHMGAHSGALNDVRRVLELKPYNID